jgi:heme-degrading monooxygenase HmoA
MHVGCYSCTETQGFFYENFGIIDHVYSISKISKNKKRQDKEFREWFNWSTQLLKKSPGFISRRLLIGNDQDYTAIVEHNGYETFMAMRTTDEHKLAHEKALGLFNGPTKMEFFEVVD